MRFATGPRPWSIRLFALLFLLAASWRLAEQLSRPLAARAAYSQRLPDLPWNEDWVIVAASAEFTIALIPIVWIYFFASRFARWFVVVLGLIGLVPQSADLAPILAAIAARPLSLIAPLATLSALALLFTPSAARWLGQGKEADRDTRA